MDNAFFETRRLELLIEKCLEKLIELGKIQRRQTFAFWYVDFAEEKLNNKGFIGAATLDSRNLPVVHLSPGLNDEGLIYTISHESVHLAQILRGDLIPGFGFTFWKGQKYKSLPYNHPKYREQPWEKEAYEVQPILFEHLQTLN